MRALLEIIIHLESFRNIDLFYQGLYYVKIKLYQKSNQTPNFNQDHPRSKSSVSTKSSQSTKRTDHQSVCLDE